MFELKSKKKATIIIVEFSLISRLIELKIEKKKRKGEKRKGKEDAIKMNLTEKKIGRKRKKSKYF